MTKLYNDILAVASGAAIALAIANGLFLFIIISIVVFLTIMTRIWLNDGWVPNSKLEDARDAAMRKYLPSPGVTDEWEKWVKVTRKMVLGSDTGAEIPGNINGAVSNYLRDQHDANEMDRLLNTRIWPKENCACDRNKTRPWTLNHKDDCIHNPDYVDPKEVMDECAIRTAIDKEIADEVSNIHPLDHYHRGSPLIFMNKVVGLNPQDGGITNFQLVCGCIVFRDGTTIRPRGCTINHEIMLDLPAPFYEEDDQ